MGGGDRMSANRPRQAVCRAVSRHGIPRRIVRETNTTEAFGDAAKGLGRHGPTMGEAKGNGEWLLLIPKRRPINLIVSLFIEQTFLPACRARSTVQPLLGIKISFSLLFGQLCFCRLYTLRLVGSTSALLRHLLDWQSFK